MAAAAKIGTDPIFGKWGLSLFLLVAAPAWGFDVNGVALGAAEAEVRKAFPTARCKPMEWKTDAAERRCDDAPVRFGGAQARITFFLKHDAVQAFDVRFEEKELRGVVEHLRQHYGRPEAEGNETFQRRGDARSVYKVRWVNGQDRAVLSSMAGRRRVDLNVWRGNFDTEIYRIK
jgi:hypothetical protein